MKPRSPPIEVGLRPQPTRHNRAVKTREPKLDEWAIPDEAVEQQGTDGAVIEASREDPEVFALIFDRHYEHLRSHFVRRVGSSLADELTSETLVTAFEIRDRFDTARTDARPWLFGIAMNKLRRHRRQERRELAAYSRAAETPTDYLLEGADARISASLLRGRLATAIAQLNDADRDTLLLHAWADFSYAETAEALGVPVGTVRSRLSRVREQLQELLAGPDAGAEEGQAR